jgi:capsular exopolysaccharide synthesis family protein
MTQLATMENQLADVQANKEIAKARLGFLKGNKPVPPELAMPATGKTPMELTRDRLTQLEEKLATLREKYTDQHPAVVATLAEIRDARSNAAAALRPNPDQRPGGGTAALSPAERAALAKQMADLEIEVTGLEAREQVLRQRVAAYNKNMSNVSAGELEGMRLMRTVDTQRNLMNSLSEKLGATRLQEQAEGRGIKVIDMATLPNQPSSSPINRLILLGAALGLAVGAGAAGLIEYVTQPIETEDEASRLTGLPVLGWVPTVERAVPASGRDEAPLNFFQDPERFGIAIEGCRTVRTALDSLAREQPLRTLMITSAGPREGKSTMLLNLALALREGDRRVIVVDSDLRRPVLHRAFRAHAEVGVADLLLGKMSWAEVTQPVSERLGFVATGAVNASNPAALLSPERVVKLLSAPRASDDLVIFDSAPVLAISDNLVLGSRVDGVILVVRAGHTQPRELIRAKRRLEQLGTTVLGLLVNHVSPRDTRRYYSRYGDYYAPSALPRSMWHPVQWYRARRAGTKPASTSAAREAAKRRQGR